MHHDACALLQLRARASRARTASHLPLERVERVHAQVDEYDALGQVRGSAEASQRRDAALWRQAVHRVVRRDYAAHKEREDGAEARHVGQQVAEVGQ